MQILAYGATDPGLRRANNEDAFLVNEEQGIYMVVDGVGGHAAGEVAAHLACNVIQKVLSAPAGTAEERIREAVVKANNRIYQEALADPERAGMSCVLSVVLLTDHVVSYGHVGDTRLYHFRPGLPPRKVTSDDSYVGYLEDRGSITETEAMDHPKRNEIHLDVGSQLQDERNPDFVESGSFSLTEDSLLLLCSDGLTDLVPLDRITEIVTQNAGKPNEMVDRLIQEANLMGGFDNITVVVLQGSGFGKEHPKRIPRRHSRTPNRRIFKPVIQYSLVAILGLLVGIYFGPFLRQTDVLKPIIPPHPSFVNLPTTDSNSLTDALFRTPSTLVHDLLSSPDTVVYLQDSIQITTSSLPTEPHALHFSLNDSTTIIRYFFLTRNEWQYVLGVPETLVDSDSTVIEQE